MNPNDLLFFWKVFTRQNKANLPSNQNKGHERVPGTWYTHIEVTYAHRTFCHPILPSQYSPHKLRKNFWLDPFLVAIWVKHNPESTSCESSYFPGGGNSNMLCLFSPKIGEDEPNFDVHIFEEGWRNNHQLDGSGNPIRNRPQFLRFRLEAQKKVARKSVVEFPLPCNPPHRCFCCLGNQPDTRRKVGNPERVWGGVQKCPKHVLTVLTRWVLMDGWIGWMIDWRI